MIDIEQPKRFERPSASRPTRRAVAASLWFHVSLLTVLLLWYLPGNDSKSSVHTSVSVSAKMMPDDQPRQDSDSSPVAIVPDEAKQNLDRSLLPAEIPAEVPADQVSASLHAKIESVEGVSNEVKLSELDKNLRRLEQISNDDHVQEVTATIASSIGIESGMYSEKEQPAEGPFDHQTAQIKQVTRTADDSGRWTYEALMVDDKGRTMLVPLSEAEGQPAYEMFERIKQYPFAESLYQQLVMPMLQKMVQSK